MQPIIKMKKILVVGDLSIPARLIIEGFKEFEDYGYQIICFDWKTLDQEDLDRRGRNIEQNGPEAEEFSKDILFEISDAEILIVDFCPVPASLLNMAHQLKVIGCLRTNTSNIDLSVAKKKKITVIHTKGRTADAVAEFTIGLMLAECRNIARAYASIKKGVWQKDFSNRKYCFNLSDKVIGLIGFGYVGQMVAKKLKGFDVKIIATDLFVSEDVFQEFGVKRVEMDYLLANSDFISVHVNLSEKTKNLLSHKEFSIMKRSCYFINTARAEIVDQNALYQALKKKMIAGAGLDVFVQEPLTYDNPFLELDNVTLTSHLAGGTQDTYYNSIKILLEDIRRWYKKEIPKNLVAIGE